MGAVVFWPKEDSGVPFQDLKVDKSCQYDTIYLEGVHPEVPTFLILDALSKYGPIEAVARKQSAQEDRRYMRVQYCEWVSAWNAVVNVHGVRMMGQGIDVWFSDSNIDIRREDSRYGEAVWDML